MKYRRFGRTDWMISEIGYGMWGMAGWTGGDSKETELALNTAVETGCNFFDTAWGYGKGESERILGKLVQRFSEERLYIATKIPPANFKWPSKKGYLLEDCFPASHIVEYTEKSLKNLAVDKIDLIQFHVWEDAWAAQDDWKKALTQLKQDGKIDKVGISVNRWEPENCIETLHTNFIDAVQVIYNIFDQAPEDILFPVCEKLDVGIIARVPFDEGTLTGNLTKDTTFPADDWRASYFVKENLISSVEHADKLEPVIPAGMTMAELALRFILNNPLVATTIPGMRKLKNVQANMQASDGARLPSTLAKQLKHHRWDRRPTEWSQ